MTHKAKRSAAMTFIGVLAVAIIIGVIVVGFNVLKNRWHKIDFEVESITVEDITDDPFEKDVYYVTVKGTAKAWFYDFNTYQFDFSAVEADEATLYGVDCGGTVVANHDDGNEFRISFCTEELSSISQYVFSAVNIYKDGVRKDAIDIRLYLGDYTDKIVYE